MRIGQAGLDLIKEFEGLRLEAYRDSVGIWTIGYGHTAEAGEPKPKAGMKITTLEAEAILLSDLGQYEAAVSKALKLTPNQNQFDAMVSLCFNIGPANFRTSKSVVGKFNAGDMQGAADGFRKWNKARVKGKLTELAGLTRRRSVERALFMLPVTPKPAPPKDDPPPKPAEEQPPPPPSPVPSKGFWAWLFGK